MQLVKTPDENDRLLAGTLPTDPADGAKPMNDAARRKAEEHMSSFTVRELLVDSMRRCLSRDAAPACTALHWQINEATGGIRPGHVWVFGAETSWGKSSYLVALADENIKQGKKVLIVSSEDAETIYADRLMARRARINFSRMRDRCLNLDEIRAVTNVANAGEELPVYLDARGKNIEAVCKRVASMISEHGIDLVAFDYLQEFRTSQRYENNERVKFRDIAGQMRGVVKDAKVAGMIMSQITIQDGKKYPDKHSIRESRDVSNAAEVVMLGFTPEESIMKEGDVPVTAGAKAIKIDKAKDGEKKIVEMRWDKSSACFDVTEKPRSEAETRANGLGDEFDQTGRYQ